MKQTVYESDFHDAFIRMGRQDQFSYEGRQMLYEFFDQLDKDTGQDTELDVIAICCDFSEEHWQDIADNYSIDLTECDDDQERCEAVQEYINENGYLVGVLTDGETIVYQSF